jgi:hypothetical protein
LLDYLLFNTRIGSKAALSARPYVKTLSKFSGRLFGELFDLLVGLGSVSVFFMGELLLLLPPPRSGVSEKVFFLGLLNNYIVVCGRDML